MAPPVETQYDALGRVMRRADDLASPQLFQTDYVYDKTGKILSQTHTDYSDDVGLHSHITETTSYQRNVSGQVQSITDALGTYTFGYDAQGRIERSTSAEGVITEWYYDEAGNLRIETTLRTDDGDWTNDPRIEYSYGQFGSNGMEK